MTHLVHIAKKVADAGPIRIVAFGSSTTEGVGASSPDFAYPAILQAELRQALHRGQIEVLNRGVGGESATEFMNRIERDALALRPDLVIWQTGSNDALLHAPLDRFRDETRAAVLKLRDGGVDVMLMELQWAPALEESPGSRAYRDVVRELGAELDVIVIRRFDLMRMWLDQGVISERDLLAPDRLHIADRGYALIARAIAAAILSDLGLSSRVDAKA